MVDHFPQHIAAWLHRHVTMLCWAVFALYVLGVTLVSALHPKANWDMIPYVAVISEAKVPDPSALHTHAYATVKAAIEPSQYAALVEGDPYRMRQSEDPEAFYSMLGMYRVKALYVALGSTLSNFVGEVQALRLITIISTFITGLTLGLWLYHRQAIVFAPIVIGLLILSGYGDSARLAIPDSLFMALFTLGLFLYDRDRHLISALALFLACLVRSDCVVFLAVWSVLLLAFKAKGPGVFAALIAALIAYPLVTSYAQHPGFWPHFMFSTIDAQQSMVGYNPAFSLGLYARALAVGVVRLLTETTWPAAIALLLPVWVFMRARICQAMPREDAIIMALVGGVIARFILFPLPDARIHGAYLAPIFLFMLPSLHALIRSKFPLNSASSAD